MAEESFFWADSLGDGGPYSQDQLRTPWKILAAKDSASVGVVPGMLNSLIVTTTGNNNLTIDTGYAMVDGTVYHNSASLALTSASPAVGTTGRMVVLQKLWGVQTVRLAIIRSVDGTATIPTVTQTDGTTWEIPIFSFTITTGGVIGALTDTREWTREAALNFGFDGGGAAISTGIHYASAIYVPGVFVALEWFILGDQSGSIVVDLWADSYANWPPTNADTITGGDEPTISGATKGTGTISAWTSPIAAGQIILPNVDSVTTLEEVSLVVRGAML